MMTNLGGLIFIKVKKVLNVILGSAGGALKLLKVIN